MSSASVPSRRRLVPYLLALLMIVLTGLAGAVWAVQARDIDRTTEEARLTGLSEAFAAHIDLTLDHYLGLLDQLGDFIGREQGVPVIHLFSEILLQNPNLLGLRVLEDGRPAIAAQRPGSTGALSWPSFRPDDTTSTRIHVPGLLQLHRRLGDGMVVEMLVDRQALLNAMAPLLDSPGRSLALFTRDGTVLARMPQLAAPPAAIALPFTANGKERFMDHGPSPFDGVNRLAIVTPIVDHALLLATTTTLDTALSGWRRTMRWLVTAWLVLSLGTLVVAHRFARIRANTDRAVEAMERSEAELRSLFHQNLQFLALLETNGRLRRVNQTALSFVGRSEQDVLGQAFWVTPWFRDDECARRSVRKGCATAVNGRTVSFSALQRDTDGRPHTFEVSLSPVVDDTGQVTALLAEGRDVTVQRRADARLRALAAQLEDSNRNLEQFAYVASHDLQEPLRTVASYLGLLRRRKADQLDDEALEFLEYANDGAVRMARLITDLLDYSRVTTGGRPFATVPLGRVLDTVMRDLASAVREAGARVHLPADPPSLTGDEGQLAQLFQNLIGNAVKYADATRPPEVWITVERDALTWRIMVRDNGIGIAPAYRERIFRIFQRLHGRDRFAGTGIGLSLAQRIVERHGGQIAVQDAVPGDWSQGSAIVVTLPVAPPQPPDCFDDPALLPPDVIRKPPLPA